MQLPLLGTPRPDIRGDASILSEVARALGVGGMMVEGGTPGSGERPKLQPWAQPGPLSLGPQATLGILGPSGLTHAHTGPDAAAQGLLGPQSRDGTVGG